MSGESEERKNLVKAIVDFSDEDILLLDKIIKGFGNKKNRLILIGFMASLHQTFNYKFQNSRIMNFF